MALGEIFVGGIVALEEGKPFVATTMIEYMLALVLITYTKNASLSHSLFLPRPSVVTASWLGYVLIYTRRNMGS